ncbi:MAG: hypothetical protein UY56_C0004G0009 [Parcubacteria group bacterium GW2011_GWA1_50_14]|uniref:Uncharacterized protein n=1 Tax=Candidatus Liptonbacteria bacterium GWB1_49_6 TaxID=1798644 RepID=A0A1G2C5G2_9BACT|nr:MAG: hypothetical protein UY56_C0004G0009 [Parcubacteria group bacterium GW2011_GWA1_50_14]OGY96665.1 MAG: hypothetical protein A2122_00565 [Candidatus Liptonbacteria bacterium GWB1_49_6]
MDIIQNTPNQTTNGMQPRKPHKFLHYTSWVLLVLQLGIFLLFIILLAIAKGAGEGFGFFLAYLLMYAQLIIIPSSATGIVIALLLFFRAKHYKVLGIFLLIVSSLFANPVRLPFINPAEGSSLGTDEILPAMGFFDLIEKAIFISSADVRERYRMAIQRAEKERAKIEQFEKTAIPIEEIPDVKIKAGEVQVIPFTVAMPSPNANVYFYEVTKYPFVQLTNAGFTGPKEREYGLIQLHPTANDEGKYEMAVYVYITYPSIWGSRESSMTKKFSITVTK